MKVLVTGAAGFIGYYTAKYLLDRGDEVVGLDNLNDYYDVNLKLARLANLEGREGFRFVKISLEDRPAMDKLFAEERFDRVVHLAAQAGVRYSLENPHSYIESNIEMPFSIHHNVDHPLALYGATKKANELMAHTYSNLYDLPTTGLRFFTVYGPFGRPDMALFMFTKNIIEGKPIDVFNYGNHRRDFTYVDDIVEGVVRTLDHVAEPNPEWDPANPDPGTSRAPYRIYNIGNSQPVELMRYIQVIEQCVGREAEKNLLPMQPGDVPDTWADVDDLVADVDYQPNTTVEEGVRRFVEWYVDFYNVDLQAAKAS